MFTSRLTALRSIVPDAHFVPLPSCNHLPLDNEPGWEVLLRELGEFLGWTDRHV